MILVGGDVDSLHVREDIVDDDVTR
jgi:hypothetical protein